MQNIKAVKTKLHDVQINRHKLRLSLSQLCFSTRYHATKPPNSAKKLFQDYASNGSVPVEAIVGLTMLPGSTVQWRHNNGYRQNYRLHLTPFTPKIVFAFFEKWAVKICGGNCSTFSARSAPLVLVTSKALIKRRQRRRLQQQQQQSIYC